jgi:hypothetical protein
MKAKTKKELCQAKLVFLNIFPVQEIDSYPVAVICSEFKRGLISMEFAIDCLDKHIEYLQNWCMNNRACNFFYGKNR